MNVRASLREVAPDWLKDYVRPQKERAVSAYVWLRAKRQRERLKPTFLIIGTGKAGTTSLFQYLVRHHPQIAAPLRKVIDYFTRYWDRPFSWYLAHFPEADRASPEVMTGEASPSYMFDPWIPERVASVLPDANIIVLLRNPVFRAISHHFHDGNRKVKRPRELAEALVAEGMEVQPELTSRLIAELGWTDRRISPSPEERWPPIYIRLGLYADHLAHWFRHFDRDRVLILKSEDLFANPQDAYARTLKFLGLRFFDLGYMKAYNVGSYDKVDPRIVRYLSEIYAEPNRRLYELLGRNFGWDGVV